MSVHSILLGNETAEVVDEQTWNRFVQNAPGGHHVQSAEWAAIKGHLGWGSTRVCVWRDGEIVAGAQMLLRPLSILGAAGYVPKGGVFGEYSERNAADLVAALHRAAREHRVRFLIVQPADNGHRFAEYLQRSRFAPSSVRAIPVATTRIDLSQSLDAIMKNMKSKTRYNVRLAGRKGVVVRDGTLADLARFHGMLQATAERQGFSDYPLAYFEKMWAEFAPQGQLKLFVAEHEGEPLSMLLAIAFGETVLFKKGAWSGKGGKLHPNEAMHWRAISWAKAHGFRYYDFEGMEESVVRQILAGEKPEQVDAVTRFKLGFGGEVRINPGVFEYIYNPVLRWGYQKVYPRLREHELMQKVADRLSQRRGHDQ